MARSYVLLPGAGLGSWIWSDVASKLGPDARSLDLWRVKEVRSQSWEDLIAQVIEEAEARESEVTLVGHSIAGLLLGPVAQRLPGVVDRVVWIGSEAPADGKAFLASNPLPLRLLLPLLFRITPKATVPPKKIIEATLCNDINEDQATRVVQDYLVMPPSVFTQPPPQPLVPDVAEKVYVSLLKDRAHEPAKQREAAAQLGARVIELDSGHLPMLSQPEALAKAIKL